MVIGAVALLGASVGCYSGVDGRVRAGLPGKDRFNTTYEVSFTDAQRAVLATLRSMGEIISHDVVRNIVMAQVERHEVSVRISETEEGAILVTTQARGSFSNANLDLANEVDKRIALDMRMGGGGGGGSGFDIAPTDPSMDW